MARPAERWRHALGAAALAVLVGGCCELAASVLSDDDPHLRVAADDVGLYALPEQRRVPHDELARALEPLRARARACGRLVLFVHGRGRQPRKAFDGQLAELEEAFDAPVLMFQWPGWAGLLGAPVNAARRSGPFLVELLGQLTWVREELPDVHLTLFAHSMGNRVVAAAALGVEKFDGDAVDRLVLSAAEVDLAGHAAWVERCTFAEEVYVLCNRDDLRLCIMQAYFDRQRLGQGRPEDDLSVFEPAAGARYVQLDGADPDHEYYRSRDPRLRALFRSLASGSPIAHNAP